MNQSRKQIAILALATASAAAVIAKGLQAADEDRSITSLLIEDTLQWIPQTDYRNKKTYQKALMQSKQPYKLPSTARRTYGFHEFANQQDTFVVTPPASPSKYTIFYLHGGSYWQDPNLFYFKFFRKLADRLNCQIVVPVYPKAPSYDAQDVHKMVLNRYIDLIQHHNVSSESIIIMGDSAGGGLALALLQVLRDQNLPLPRQGFLISPWLDITNSNMGMQLVQPRDPILNIEKLAFQGREYAGNLDSKDPLVSPIYGKLPGLPPLSVITGTRDILYADILKYQNLCQEQDLKVSFHIFDKQLHCFIGFPIPESDIALDLIAKDIENLK